MFIRDTLTILGLIGYLLYLNCEADGCSPDRRPADRVADPQRINLLFRRYSRRIQNSMGDVTRVAKEAIEAPRVIQVFNAQDYEARLFDAGQRAQPPLAHEAHADQGPERTQSCRAIASIGLAGVLYFATVDAINGRMTVGDFTSFIAALMLITAPLRRLVNVAGPLQQGIAAAQSIFEVLDAPPEPAGRRAAVERARGEVEFRDVGFRYARATAIRAARRQLSRARAGETIAIVGRSGSGKSTLVSLLPRFYDVDRRRRDCSTVATSREYALHDLREQVSLVSQDVVLFNDTIRSNIAFGHVAARPRQIEAAAAAARVHRVHARSCRTGSTRSSAIAARCSPAVSASASRSRARCCKNAPILILDEATSALDTESNARSRISSSSSCANRTTLVIAHRLSTVEKADRIVVMDGGRLVETGTHAELLARDGQYAVLHRLQFNE